MLRYEVGLETTLWSLKYLTINSNCWGKAKFYFSSFLFCGSCRAVLRGKPNAINNNVPFFYRVRHQLLKGNILRAIMWMELLFSLVIYDCFSRLTLGAFCRSYIVLWHLLREGILMNFEPYFRSEQELNVLCKNERFILLEIFIILNIIRWN